jgi:hypothetical protein
MMKGRIVVLCEICLERVGGTHTTAKFQTEFINGINSVLKMPLSLSNKFMGTSHALLTNFL